MNFCVLCVSNINFFVLLIEDMDLSHAEAQRRRGRRKERGNFNISYNALHDFLDNESSLIFSNLIDLMTSDFYAVCSQAFFPTCTSSNLAFVLE